MQTLVPEMPPRHTTEAKHPISVPQYSDFFQEKDLRFIDSKAQESR